MATRSLTGTWGGIIKYPSECTFQEYWGDGRLDQLSRYQDNTEDWLEYEVLYGENL